MEVFHCSKCNTKTEEICHAEFYSEHYFTVLNGFIRQKNGYIDLNDEPGLGLELNEDEIAKHPPIKKPTSSGGTIRGI